MSRLLLFLLVLLVGAACQAPPAEPIADPHQPAHAVWDTYLGDAHSTQYSSLDQITPANVTDLEVAWTYRTGDASATSQIQCNPLIIGRTLYGTTAGLKVFAADATTGIPQWTFDPVDYGAEINWSGANRGLVYWRDEAGSAPARIMYTAGAWLYAIDAATGILLEDFGTGGRVSLKTGLGTPEETDDLFIVSNTPGVLYGDLLILGGRVHEGPGPSMPGHIRAFNVRTGAMAWIFHTIPKPGEFGADTWLDYDKIASERIGGANAWSGLTVDHERGMVFIPTGSATWDFYGAARPGDNLFANTLLALDAATGERIWHQQIVKHDLWDRDLPASPNLVTVMHDGERVDAVAQVTKDGHVWVFDRDTGAPLFPVEEVPQPPSDLEGEWTPATQRLPTQPPPFARQVFREADITDRTPEATAYVRARFDGVRSDGQFVPPSTQGTMIFPGFDGGGEWGGAAIDPATGLLYVNSNEMPWILTMVDLTKANSRGEMVYQRNCAACHRPDRSGIEGSNFPSLLDLEERRDQPYVTALLETGRGFMPSFAHLSVSDVDALLGYLYEDTTASTTGSYTQHSGSPYGHTGYNRFFDQDGYPAIKPPWGQLNAIDLNNGTIRWQVPLGEFPELTAQGIPKTGTENYGGPVVTAGGLIFIAASKDEHIRAFDKTTGKELWQHKLPFGGYATPATYSVDGTQYVVIAAGGGKMGTASGDAYVAFALPDTNSER
ncbi:MAG: PQQ-binding-like beta-propeller repeat protein [Bacteroidota bacterium]